MSGIQMTPERMYTASSTHVGGHSREAYLPDCACPGAAAGPALTSVREVLAKTLRHIAGSQHLAWACAAMRMCSMGRWRTCTLRCL